MTQQLSRDGIGASEIAAVAGLNPYCSPWDVWLRKTGQAPDIEETAPMEWGIRLEPAIRQKYVDETQLSCWVPPTSLFHAGTQWARATPDGIVCASANEGTGWEWLLQCKNVGAWVERSWKDAPPPYVQLQEQWEMYVTGLARADVAVLIGGNEFRIYTVQRDDRVIADLVDIATAFWRRVESKTPPPIDESDACRDHFTGKLAKGTGVELVADEATESLFAEWKVLHQQTKSAEKRIKMIRNLVLADLVSAQADRVVSSAGIAKLQRRGGKDAATTEWKLIAELLGSRACTPEEWSALVDTNTITTTKDETTVLVCPREWSKETP